MSGGEPSSTGGGGSCGLWHTVNEVGPWRGGRRVGGCAAGSFGECADRLRYARSLPHACDGHCGAVPE
jgi:hypothetical protein